MGKPKKMSKGQEKQRRARLAKKGEEAPLDYTCHPNARIAAIAIDDPERLRELIEKGEIE